MREWDAAPFVVQASLRAAAATPGGERIGGSAPPAAAHFACDTM